MARKTQMNRITDSESLSQVNPDNMRLLEDFMDYLKSTQKSTTTIAVYRNDIEIAWVWCLKRNRNKFFVEWTKRDVMSFQNYLVNENMNSPARVRRIKATLSSLSNFIENVLDDEYKDFRNIIHKIESPVSQPVREKTVLSDEQLQSLLNTLTEAGEYEKACMLALGAASGRRKAELVLFKTHYFDDSNIIHGSLYCTPEKIKTKGRGNGKFVECYTLVKQFKPYFDLWMAERERLHIDSEWLFPSVSNSKEHIGLSTMNSWARTFSNILGVDFYWHSLRHFMTTFLAKSGIPDSVIAQIIHWESVDMVSVYNDTTVNDSLAKYFGSEGIIKQEAKSISDL